MPRKDQDVVWLSFRDEAKQYNREHSMLGDKHFAGYHLIAIDPKTMEVCHTGKGEYSFLKARTFLPVLLIESFVTLVLSVPFFAAGLFALYLWSTDFSRVWVALGALLAFIIGWTNLSFMRGRAGDSHKFFVPSEEQLESKISEYASQRLKRSASKASHGRVVGL